MRRRGLLALVVAAALAAGGCGSPAPTGGPVDSAFRSRANAACELTLSGSAPDPFPYPNFVATDPAVSELPTVGEYVDAVAFNHEELSFVRSFGHPGRGTDTWRAFVDLVEQQQALVATQISTAKAADKAGFVASVNQIQELGTKIAAAGSAAGFAADSYCVQLFR